MLSRVQLTTLVIISLALGVSIVAVPKPTLADDQATIAEVQGQRFSEADLERKQSAKLLAARYQYYQAERKAVDELIDEYLLSKEAEKEKVTVDELLQRKILSKLKDPTEDQLRVFYEGLNVDQSYESLREKILDNVRHLRAFKARAAYLKELRAEQGVKILLEPPSADVSAANAPVRGPAEAPVSLIEFADYECPYCKQIEPDLRRLEEQFHGKLKVAFRDFPLPMHHHAQKAAEATHCAEAQGHFWEFHDALMGADASQLDVAELKSRSQTLKLDQKKFEECLDSGQQAPRIQQDVAAGQSLGLTGTPSFFFNGHFLSGTVPYDTFRDVVEMELKADHKK